MAASAFHPISTSLTLVSQTLTDVAAAIPAGTSGEGATAEALVAKLHAWRSAFGEISEHMQAQVSGPVSETASADDELTRHPSPEQVQEADTKAKLARNQLMAKAISSTQYKAVADEAQSLREEREQAVQRHREAIKDMARFESKAVLNSDQSADIYGRGGAFGTLHGGASSFGGGLGAGGAISGAGIGTHMSGDSISGGSGSRIGGVPQPPAMPPMMQPAAMPAGGEMPQGAGMGAMPQGATPPRDKRKADDKDTVATGLSGDLSGGGAVAATATAAPESRGSSIKGVSTAANISGMGGQSVAGSAAPPGAGGAGGSGGARPMVGGAPMGSMGSGAGLKAAKPRPDIRSNDSDLLGNTTADEAIQGGRIGRESVKKLSEVEK